MGKGGVDTVPSDERSAPEPPAHLAEVHGNSESLARPVPHGGFAKAESIVEGSSTLPNNLLPRETGEDIGMGSPVPLSSEAVGIITKLRNMKVGATR